MESFFSFSTLLNLVLTVIWFVSGIRDFQGKDPLINLPFNQYNRDPEYRAMWQKKERRVLHAQRHRLSDLNVHTCYIAALPYHLRRRHRRRSSLSRRLRKLEP